MSTTRNEAAERLRMALDLADTLDHAIKSRQSGHIVDGHATEYRRFRLGMSVNEVDEALRTERRNVVEQIAEELTAYEEGEISWADLLDAFGLVVGPDERYVLADSISAEQERREPVSNEAAERLRGWIEVLIADSTDPEQDTSLLDEALATERRNTVERIKATQPVAVLATDGGPALAYAMRITEWLDSIATGTEEEGK